MPLLFICFAVPFGNFTYLNSAIDFVWFQNLFRESDPAWQWFMCEILKNFECKLNIRQKCKINSETLIYILGTGIYRYQQENWRK